METKYTIFAVLLCFGMGFYFGQMADFNSKEQMAPEETFSSYDPKYSALEQKLLELEKVDLKHFQSIKGNKEKYLAANKIYAKVLGLFMGNLNFRVNKETWQSLSYHKISPNEIKLEEIPVRPNIQKTAPPPLENSPSSQRNGQTNAINIFDKIVNRMRKKDLFGDKGKIKKPTEYYQNSVTIQSPNKLFQVILGNYHGVIQLLNGTTSKYTLKMKSEYSFDGVRYTGSSEILIKNSSGKVISKDSQTGSNRSFFVNLDDPKTILVGTTENSFIHLNYNKFRNAFSGYFYQRKNKKSKFKVTGRLSRLTKENQ